MSVSEGARCTDAPHVSCPVCPRDRPVSAGGGEQQGTGGPPPAGLEAYGKQRTDPPTHRPGLWDLPRGGARRQSRRQGRAGCAGPPRFRGFLTRSLEPGPLTWMPDAPRPAAPSQAKVALSPASLGGSAARVGRAPGPSWDRGRRRKTPSWAECRRQAGCARNLGTRLKSHSALTPPRADSPGLPTSGPAPSSKFSLFSFEQDPL